MTEPTGPASTPFDAAAVPQDGNKESSIAIAVKMLHHAGKRLLDLFYPPPMRSDYRLIFAKLSENRFTSAFLILILIFCLAEYEQPGWFPRPDEISNAIIGFLGAATIILPSLALLEYVETNTWPWEDEGFVWPWEALLWSATVYNDETFSESVTAYANSYDKPATRSLRVRLQLMYRHGPAFDVATGGSKSSSSPEASLEHDDMIIPPTPFLPRGLRPAHLPSPTQDWSGLLGPSPTPAQSKCMNGKPALECSEPEEKRAA